MLGLGTPAVVVLLELGLLPNLRDAVLIVDLNSDGLGDALKLTFNQPMQDTSFVINELAQDLIITARDNVSVVVTGMTIPEGDTMNMKYVSIVI